MINSWLRLWHDLPNDPKWRTIARVSGQPISVVIAVYIHLLVEASKASERGVTHCDAEDIASALDEQAENIQAVFDAMQGRVLANGRLTGWSLRQPVREDASAERAKQWRERKRTQRR